jgi:formylmethanofuran dehydrogenase subunit E-like metal-binding protein
LFHSSSDNTVWVAVATWHQITTLEKELKKGWDKNYCSQIKVLLWHLIERVEENNDNPQSSQPMLYPKFKFSTV